jgi:hypothetical protein
MYINGVLHNSEASTATFSNSGSLQIGDGGDGNFNGVIEDVRIYNRALSTSEVQKLYKLGK